MIRTSRRFTVLRLLGLGAAVVWLILSLPLPYGRGADIAMPGQKAIVVYDEQTGREDLILSVQLLSASPKGAWVVPVPSPPR
jgi:hypothetical protein